ncbi:hypothetical protein EGR_07645 [Echinococcus granulosus]|uniref:Uncharacterized protein n=1 Tax=Echinococcus granulosus TaxID=6210 RepID=W6U907_ECHGR|nr:hypothetical protein EGR_07645 [Echinococcus granulosus]EUB57480.1 hypothetical protein EGR_07645 [Echinococcus granulosus]
MGRQIDTTLILCQKEICVKRLEYLVYDKQKYTMRCLIVLKYLYLYLFDYITELSSCCRAWLVHENKQALPLDTEGEKVDLKKIE